MENFDEIWQEDLFSRRKEAEDIIGYLESVAQRPAIREDGHAHVLAIDAGYGYGKSFFLRRLARHMRHSHAVAFVDAWVDDLEDEPIVALAATLEGALEPYLDDTPGLKERLANFRLKAGKVSKIVGIGLLKRAAGLVITQGAAEAVSDVMAGADDVAKDIDKDALKGTGTGIVDDAIRGWGQVATPSMDVRIARFREGQAAIISMKAALAEVVESLAAYGVRLPITIVIDELDRCRPTYAIKLLEEVKHLFDVSGVAFILGLHGEQLAHSVTAAYGQGFDGDAYLRRFFNRRYTLREVGLDPLVAKLLAELSIPDEQLQHWAIVPQGGNDFPKNPAGMIAAYMAAYGLTARDAFEFVEILQTSVALTMPKPVFLPYLLPLIVGHMRGIAPEALRNLKEIKWAFATSHERFTEGGGLLSMNDAFRELHALASMSDNDLMTSVNKNHTAAAAVVASLSFDSTLKDAYSRPSNYSKLLQTVQRFVSK